MRYLGPIPQEDLINAQISTEISAGNIKPPSMYNYNPTVTGLSYGRILVNWSSWAGLTDPNVFGYDVFCTTDSNCLATDANLFGTYLRGSNFVISGLARGSTYYVRVRPRSENGIGIESEIVSTELPADTDLVQSTSLPVNLGDIKIVSGVGSGGPVVVIHDCDTIAAWSAVSGSPTIALDTTSLQQGVGCVRVQVPPNSSVIVKCVVSAKDLSAKSQIRFYLKQSHVGQISSFTVYFGESVYNEQSLAISTPTTSWQDSGWNIGAIAAASRDGVTIFAIGCTNTNLYNNLFFYIDYIRGEGATEKLEVALSDHVLDLTQVDIERTVVFTDHFFELNTLVWSYYGTLLAALNGVMRVLTTLAHSGGFPFSASKNPILRISQAQYGAVGTRRLGLTTALFAYTDQTGIYWRYTNAGNYIAVCRSGVNETTLDTGIAASVGVFHKLRLEITPTLVSVYVDDVLKGTIDSNITSSAMDFAGNSTSASTGFDIDYVQVIQDT